ILLRLRGAALIDVCDVKCRLRGQELKFGEGGSLRVRLRSVGASRFALIEMRRQLLAEGHQDLLLGVAAVALFARTVESFRHGVEVLQAKLGVDGLDVADGVHAPVDVGHVLVLKASHHMGDRIDLTDVSEELVPEAFAFRSTTHETRDVDKADTRGDLDRLVDLCELLESRIGNRNDTDVGLNGTKWEVLRLRFRSGERVEQ